ncbi:two-component system response regulator CreB [Endozoicomonas sp. G2_1]|uniref:two-component system response regulator CreB n=1 Tax=Endozoicomonas sp. G2_1 TaxID=2821091 RepID=UPI001AD9B3D7|nr:two-component system response regulator CreB [Endozoicomonas sp. G2_1]MBO9489892.1 two-component system response regulator CreB [Endozoicomonas sp. G2_1]
MNKNILVIEDEPSIADNVCYSLKQEGFVPTCKSLGGEVLALHRANSIDFALIILDVGLPDINGFEVCKAIRETSDVPIIFLTARSEEIDRVVGLEIGGDDYVVKPFSPRELVARVKVVLKRINSHKIEGVEPALFRVEPQAQQIYFSEKLLSLTYYEYGVLATLLSQPDRIFSRTQLMDKVWKTPEESFDRVIDTHIKTIRAKLRNIDPTYNPIATHRGVGYSIKLGK